MHQAPHLLQRDPLLGPGPAAPAGAPCRRRLHSSGGCGGWAAAGRHAAQVTRLKPPPAAAPAGCTSSGSPAAAATAACRRSSRHANCRLPDDSAIAMTAFLAFWSCLLALRGNPAEPRAAVRALEVCPSSHKIQAARIDWWNGWQAAVRSSSPRAHVREAYRRCPACKGHAKGLQADRARACSHASSNAPVPVACSRQHTCTTHKHASATSPTIPHACTAQP